MSKDKAAEPVKGFGQPGQLQYLMMEAMASAVYYSLSFYLLPYRTFVQVSRTEKNDEE